MYAFCAGVPGDWLQRSRLIVRELMAESCAISFKEPVDEDEVGEAGGGGGSKSVVFVARYRVLVYKT